MTGDNDDDNVYYHGEDDNNDWFTRCDRVDPKRLRTIRWLMVVMEMSDDD